MAFVVSILFRRIWLTLMSPFSIYRHVFFVSDDFSVKDSQTEPLKMVLKYSPNSTCQVTPLLSTFYLKSYGALSKREQ